MKLSISIANKLRAMVKDGSSVPASSMQGSVVEKMVEDGVLQKRQTGRTKSLLFIRDETAFTAYLLNHFGIADLAAYVEKLSSEELTRGEAVAISGDSKLKTVRTFKGFLVNSYAPVQATLNEKPFVVHPAEGSFTFIYDYKTFVPEDSVTIVGIENPENFRHIKRQRYLFKDLQTLFVCRYPHSNDLVNWLKSIPNLYLHFGDLDFGGFNIYLNEYKRHLGEKASFFIPFEIEELLDKFGNRELYNKQLKLASDNYIEEGISELVQLFHKYKKVLEQEVFITSI